MAEFEKEIEEDSSYKLLLKMGSDGKSWAKEFMKIWGNRRDEIDYSLMFSWFANAIMAGYDKAKAEKTHQIKPVQEFEGEKQED